MQGWNNNASSEEWLKEQIPKVMNIDNLHLFIVQFSLFYTGLQLFIYSIAVNKWTILIPAILFLCMFAIRYYTLPFDIVSTIAIVILSVITSIVTLKFAYYWALIPISPIVLLLGLRTYQKG